MEVSKICVSGGGIMGNQIAQLAALSGYEVWIHHHAESYKSSVDIIKATLQKFFVDKGKMSQDEAEAVLNRINETADLGEAVAGVQVVIESIPDDIQVKQELFKKLDEVCAPETILASGTSALLIAGVGSLAKRKDKIVGMHFWNPVAVLKLVDIIRTPETSDETCEVIKELGIKLGKEVITVKDSPSGVVGRLFACFCNEAAKILEEGLATAEDIDKGCVLGLGHAMGPFKTQDIINGTAVTVQCLKTLQAAFGDAYAPTKLQEKMAEAGEIGVQAGKGFYNYK